jgi:hypothetical protein
VTVNLLAGNINAGFGGRAFGTGDAGDGSDVTLIDVVDGETTGDLNLSMRGDAGRGGRADGGGAHGAPGDSYVELNKSGSFNDLRLSSHAVGGGAQSGGAGGTGTAVVDASNDAGFVAVDSQARGGAGVGGAPGGDASATGTGTATGAGTSVIINRIFSQGGDSLTAGGTGGSGTGSGIGTANGNGAVNITVDTSGGRAIGGGTGGLADGSALGTNVGTGNVSMVVTSAGGNVQGGVGTVGNAIANATGSGELGSVSATATALTGIPTGGALITEGMATATSSATMTGATRTGTGTADSTAIGGSGSASSMAEASAGFTTLAHATANAPVAGDAALRSTSDSLGKASVGNLGFLQAPTIFLTNEAIALAAGDPNNIPAFNSLNPTVFGELGGGSLLLYGIVGGGSADSVIGTAMSYVSVLDFSFDMTSFAGTPQLLIGLLDPTVEGAGFDSARFRISQEGVTVVDQNFASAAAALAYFDDSVLDMGFWKTGITGDLDLRFQLDIVSSTASDGFYANLVAGVVIPEPGTLSLLGPGLALLAWTRRSSRTHASSVRRHKR